MRLRDVIGRLEEGGGIAVSIEGLCDEYEEGIDRLRREDWYKDARDRKVRCLGVLMNGHQVPELWIRLYEKGYGKMCGREVGR